VPFVPFMETRDRIILKAIELFTRLGIRYVTMDQIAGELGMSKRTLYEIFRDKDDLLSHCLIEIGRRHREEIHEIIAGSENIIAALFRIAEHSEKKKASANILFFEDLEKYHPKMIETLRKSVDGKEPVIKSILKKGISEGIFKNEIDIDIVNTFIHEMMKICSNPSIFQVKENRVIIDNVIIPYFLGISTGKGQVLIDLHFKNYK